MRKHENRTQRANVGLLWLALGTLVTGCVKAPAPIVIYEDRSDSVWLKFDPEAATGHSHPYALSSVQMATVLRGVWVKDRDVIGGFGKFGGEEGAPAFSNAEVVRLSPYLAEALRKASPKDMVTFYVTKADPSRGKLITSGGVFVRDGRLYVVLANCRTSPSSVQYENTYAIDTRDEPLLPLARYKFAVGFTPDSARIPNAQLRGTKGYERYLDESKLLVIDLQRLAAETEPFASPAKPPSSQPHP